MVADSKYQLGWWNNLSSNMPRWRSTTCSLETYPFFGWKAACSLQYEPFFFACYPQKGQTPLHYAAQNDHSQVVTLFLTHKPGVMMQQNAVRRQKIITKGCSHSLWRRANAQSVCSETLYGGQVTELIKKIILLYSPTDAAPQFLKNPTPFIC